MNLWVYVHTTTITLLAAMWLLSRVPRCITLVTPHNNVLYTIPSTTDKALDALLYVGTFRVDFAATVVLLSYLYAMVCLVYLVYQMRRLFPARAKPNA